MNIYTFYKKIVPSHVPTPANHSAQLDIINFWKESWSKYGWNPIVLGMDDIEKDDFFWKYYNVISKLPPHNSLSFLIAHFLKYFAVYQASIRNNDDLFSISDYDMINYGLTPDMFPKEPCYHRHLTLWPPILSQETFSTFINMVIDKFTNHPKRYLDKGHLTTLKKNKDSFSICDMTFVSKLHEYDEIPIKRNIEKENIYIECGIMDIKHNLNIGFQYSNEQLDRIRISLKERWKSMNFIHLDGETAAGLSKIYENELDIKSSYDIKVATKADIVRFINKSNEES